MKPSNKLRFTQILVPLIAAFIFSSALIPSSILNAEEKAGRSWPAAQRLAYSEIDHGSYDRLLKKYVDKDGMVAYRTWHANATDRAALRTYLAELGKADKSKPSSKAAKLAYWINAYNATTIEGILRVYPTSSIRNHTARLIGYNIWKNLKLTSGDEEVSLEHMEHEILRKMHEPRIHFAIVCASIGCPRLLNEAYTADRLERQLALNSRDFFSRNQNLRVDYAKKTLYLSSIISWFGSDFGKTQVDQLKTLSPYFPETARTLLESGNYRISFLDYNWNLNERSVQRQGSGHR